VKFTNKRINKVVLLVHNASVLFQRAYVEHLLNVPTCRPVL